MTKRALHHTVAVAFLALAIAGLPGCSVIRENPRAAKGAAIGTAAGAGTGAAIGAVVGGGKGAAQGAAIGAVVGLLGGTLAGSYMDSQAKEMQAILAEQDRIRQEANRLNVTMSSDTLFATGSAEIFAGAREKLRQFATVLNKYPQTTIVVTGHTDSRGTAQLNQTLSEQRAKAVADTLIADGVSAARVTTHGVGASQPLADNSTPEGRAQNRRVEITVNDTGAQTQPTGGAPAAEPR